MRNLNPHLDVRAPSFRAFLFAQFTGALNDNGLRLLTQLLILRQMVDSSDPGQALGIAGLVFAAPFVLFSTFAGVIADRYPKHKVIFWTKALELALMPAALIVLFAGNTTGILLVLFLTGTQSALFSPAKYGLIPEVVREDRISAANGLLAATTFMAITLGTAVGAAAYAYFEGSLMIAALPFAVLSALGLWAARHVPRCSPIVSESPPAWNPFINLSQSWKKIVATESLPHAVIGLAFFYFVASIFQMCIFIYGDVVLDLASSGKAIMAASLAAGACLGSYGAGRWSDEKVELGLVPMGAFAMALGGIMLWFTHNAFVASCLVTAWTGMGGGFFVVPLLALLQQRAPAEDRGRTIAFSNTLNFVAIMAGSLIVWLLLDPTRMSPRSLILGLGLLSLAMTALSLYLLPMFFVRFTIWLLTHTIYQINVEGRENIPQRGPALLLPNHVSWVDAVIMQSTLQRFIRFMMYRPYYEFRPTHLFFRAAHVIPVAKGDTPERTEASLQQAADELAEGHVVIIFAEGKLTRDGFLSPFRRGFRRILDKVPEGTEVPIVPVALVGLWGSIFSYEGGKFIWKWPKRLPYRMTVRYGTPLPSTTRPDELQEIMEQLLKSEPASTGEQENV